MTISVSFSLSTLGLRDEGKEVQKCMVLNSVAPWLLFTVFIRRVDVYLIHSRFLQVSVFGGYTDERGDAARNSMSLLEALHDQERTLEVGRVMRFQFIIIITLSSVIIITHHHYRKSSKSLINVVITHLLSVHSWLSFAWVHITQERTRRERMKQFWSVLVVFLTRTVWEWDT